MRFIVFVLGKLLLIINHSLVVSQMKKQKRILITGANSYIGESVKEYLLKESDKYSVDTIEAKGLNPLPVIFKGYDVVFNVAGIAHIKETKLNEHLYYEVNRDLAIQIAQSAKVAGVKQLILLSSMSVYGLLTGHITKVTVPHPSNAYGKSKLQADMEIKKLEDSNFIFACLRPPMVYGKDCKGNYQTLRKFVLASPVFPEFKNERSMIYIGNLCEFVKRCIDFEKSGLFFPQNDWYTNTSEMARLIIECNEKTISFTKAFNWLVKIAPMNVVKKVFGNLTYEAVDMVGKYGFKESISLTERG